MNKNVKRVISAFVILAVLGVTYVLNFGLYPRFFDIEWDEEVKLHDGRVIVVHVKRTFERRDGFDRWLAHDRDTEIAFDAGLPWGKFKRNFERYDVKMIEEKEGNWYIALGGTTGIPPKKIIDRAYPILILRKDGSERPATSWAEVPDFPQQNMMPVTPSPQGISVFDNSFLSWDTKMAHWKNHPRAAGDNGMIIQRHTIQKAVTQ